MRVEHALGAGEEGYRRLIALLPVAVYTCESPSGVITFYNDQAAALWGRAPRVGDTDERFCGSFRLYWPDGTYLPHDGTPMAVCVREGRTYRNEEVVIERPDGARLTVRVSIDPLFDDQGRLVGAVNAFSDTTALKRAEQALRDSEARLQEQDRRKNEFLAMLAHELRNPLAPIRNGVEILRCSDKDADAAGPLLDVMARQIDQLVRLVDDLLDVSRISLGMITLYRERVELTSIVAQAVETARPLCERSGHRLTVALPQEPLFVDVDATRLSQVLGNLLSNACKFTRTAGNVRLGVEREGEQAVIRVRDDGIGMDADQLARIFERFVQVDTSLERSQHGLGIGLSLAKELVEMHGGTIEARSDGVGRGSEFVVRLPALREPVQRSSPVTPDRRPALAVARRVLVVDDNRDAAESLARLLELSGHEVHTAHDGLDALAAAQRVRPTVVLLDLGLPRLNGYEVARRIREQHPGSLLVAVTGWGEDDVRRRSREAGFDAHLVKPVDLAALAKLLAESDPG
jgi:signal transduction histidine kinase